MIKNYVFIAITIAALIIASCNSSEKQQANSPKTYKTKTGKTIIVKESHPVGQSLSNIEIYTTDFEHNYTETYESKDPIADVFVVDLDNNDPS